MIDEAATAGVRRGPLLQVLAGIAGAISLGTIGTALALAFIFGSGGLFLLIFGESFTVRDTTASDSWQIIVRVGVGLQILILFGLLIRHRRRIADAGWSIAWWITITLLPLVLYPVVFFTSLATADWG